MKWHAGLLGIGALLAGCATLSKQSAPTSELELESGRGPIHTVLSNVYEFPADAAPQDPLNWMPSEDGIAVVTAAYEYDRGGWVARQEMWNREGQAYHMLRECWPGEQSWRECRMSVAPSEFGSGEITLDIDGENGFRSLVKLRNGLNVDMRVWRDRHARIVYNESHIRDTALPWLVGVERHQDADGYDILKITRDNDGHEKRVTYERLSVDPIGNITRSLERQDPAFPDPQRPSTVRLMINEYRYYDTVD